MSERETHPSPDFERMSDEEVVAWQDAEIARSRAAGHRPLRRGEYNERKWSDPPVLQFDGYSFQLRDDFPIVVRAGGDEHLARIDGLVQQDDAIYLTITTHDGPYRLTRRDGKPWATSVTAHRATVPDPWVPVIAEPLATTADHAATNEAATPRAPHQWAVYTPFRWRPEDEAWTQQYAAEWSASR